jgi:hypothetical protein
MPDFTPIVSDAYREILGRAPDPGGLDGWNRNMNQGLSEAGMREALLRSEEYAQKHPDPSPAPALHVEGSRFVNALGAPVRLLGAIVCCENAKPNGWPLVTLEVLEQFASQALNYTHCRLGPFTIAGEEDASYVGYVSQADGRVDLDRFHEPFWERCRAIAGRARELGIYVEFDLVDRWVRQHGADDLPAIDPWRARNNVQGVELGGLGIFQAAPRPVHERWIRKAVGELGSHENVLFQIGNEGFKSYSAAWELGVHAIVKDELARRGHADRLVATNTADAALESRVDYATRHSTRAQDPGPYPILVNEYPTIAPAEVERQVIRAERLGTMFEYWRGAHDEQEWSRTLEALGREARGLVQRPGGAGRRRAARRTKRSTRAARKG